MINLGLWKKTQESNNFIEISLAYKSYLESTNDYFLLIQSKLGSG